MSRTPPRRQATSAAQAPTASSDQAKNVPSASSAAPASRGASREELSGQAASSPSVAYTASADVAPKSSTDGASAVSSPAIRAARSAAAPARSRTPAGRPASRWRCTARRAPPACRSPCQCMTSSSPGGWPALCTGSAGTSSAKRSRNQPAPYWSADERREVLVRPLEAVEREDARPLARPAAGGAEREPGGEREREERGGEGGGRTRPRPAAARATRAAPSTAAAASAQPASTATAQRPMNGGAGSPSSAPPSEAGDDRRRHHGEAPRAGRARRARRASSAISACHPRGMVPRALPGRCSPSPSLAAAAARRPRARTRRPRGPPRRRRRSTPSPTAGSRAPAHCPTSRGRHGDDRASAAPRASSCAPASGGSSSTPAASGSPRRPPASARPASSPTTATTSSSPTPPAARVLIFRVRPGARAGAPLRAPRRPVRDGDRQPPRTGCSSPRSAATGSGCSTSARGSRGSGCTPTPRQPDAVAVDERTGRVYVSGRADGVLQILDRTRVEHARGRRRAAR